MAVGPHASKAPHFKLLSPKLSFVLKLLQVASTDTTRPILPAFSNSSNLEYAVKFSQDKENPYYQGINQTYQKAVNILNQNGIEQITGEGEPFDYTKQNAVAHVDDESLPESTVKEVMQTGYSYKGKVIRTASVTVAN